MMIDYADTTTMVVDQMTPSELRRACKAITRLIALAGKRQDCDLMAMAVEKLRLLQRRRKNGEGQAASDFKTPRERVS